MQLQTFSLDRAHAAMVVGISETQISNWIAKNGLFAAKRLGTGKHFSFGLEDILTMASAKALIDAGIAPAVAIDICGDADIYGAWLGSKTGVLFLIKNHEDRWVEADSLEAPVSLQVRLWPIFDAVYPRYCDAVREHWDEIPKDHLEGSIAALSARIEKIRRTPKTKAR